MARSSGKPTNTELVRRVRIVCALLEQGLTAADIAERHSEEWGVRISTIEDYVRRARDVWMEDLFAFRIEVVAEEVASRNRSLKDLWEQKRRDHHAISKLLVDRAKLRGAYLWAESTEHLATILISRGYEITDPRTGEQVKPELPGQARAEPTEIETEIVPPRVQPPTTPF